MCMFSNACVCREIYISLCKPPRIRAPSLSLSHLFNKWMRKTHFFHDFKQITEEALIPCCPHGSHSFGASETADVSGKHPHLVWLLTANATWMTGMFPNILAAAYGQSKVIKLPSTWPNSIFLVCFLNAQGWLFLIIHVISYFNHHPIYSSIWHLLWLSLASDSDLFKVIISSPRLRPLKQFKRTEIPSVA